MHKYIAITFILALSFSCNKRSTTGVSKTYTNLTQVDFCDLTKYEGQLVYIKAAYSGVDEYWALNSMQRCKNRLNVELDDKAGTPIPSQYQNLFDSAYSSYWNTYLIVELTGVFDSRNPDGYGHLGSNKARLIVKDYINVTLVKNKISPNIRLDTIRARRVCFNSTAGVNWLKEQDSQFRQPGSCRVRTASSPVRWALFYELIYSRGYSKYCCRLS